MPFTFSHPALVLPLTYLPKRWYSLTGLVVGSVTPDFEYFIRMKDLTLYSHTVPGIFYFDLPLGLLLSFVFHSVARNPVIKNLPPFFKTRFISFTAFDWTENFRRNWLIIVISIVIGAASHILWDGFTHMTGYFVHLFPALKKLVNIFGYKIRIYNVLQHLSTVVGFVIVIFAIAKMPKNKILNERIDGDFWICVILMCLIIMVLRTFAGLNFKVYGETVISIVASGIWGVLLVSFYVSWLKRQSAKRLIS